LKRKTLLACILVACLCTGCKSAASKDNSGSSPSKEKELVTINLNDYILPHYSGYDTVGNNSSSVDLSSIILDNRSSFGLTLDATDMQFQPILSCLESNIAYTISKSGTSDSSYISNGDVLTVDFDDEKIQKLNEDIVSEGRWNVKFDFEDTSISVEGLEELKEYELNKIITVSCFDHKYYDNRLEVLIEYNVSTEEEIEEIKKILSCCEIKKSELGKEYVNISITDCISNFGEGIIGFKRKNGFTLSQESYDIKFVDTTIIPSEEEYSAKSAVDICSDEKFHGMCCWVFL